MFIAEATINKTIKGVYASPVSLLMSEKTMATRPQAKRNTRSLFDKRASVSIRGRTGPSAKSESHKGEQSIAGTKIIPMSSGKEELRMATAKTPAPDKTSMNKLKILAVRSMASPTSWVNGALPKSNKSV